VSKPISVVKFVAAVQELLPQEGPSPAIGDTPEVDEPENPVNKEVESPGPEEAGGEETI